VQLVVVFWDSEPEAARAIRAAAEQTRQPIYAVSGAGVTPELASSLGATGVLSSERLQEDLVQTVDTLRRTKQVPDNHGRFVAVAAAQEGSGVTTVATGLAFGLAGKDSVLLTEFGSGTPALALNLDLNPRHSLPDLLRASDRGDVSMVREAVAQHPGGVAVLGYAPESLTPEPIPANVSRDLQVLFRSAFAWSVVDAGSGLTPTALDLFGYADALVLVTRLDPPALRLTRRYVLALADRGVPVDAVTVVANRYDQPGLVPWAKAEQVLRTKVAAWLPDDANAVNRALRDGKPLTEVARRARLTRELSKLADAIRARLMPAR
jgi:Flp pilus assembly CpaE family ATPase